jgi:hypothetical protein
LPVAVLVRVAAPPRLGAHLRAVHDAAWQAFLVLDGVLDAVAAGADARLAFENSYPLA